MKRYFLALPLFFFLFSVLFSTNAHATSCCPNMCSPIAGGTECSCYGGTNAPYQCTGAEPYCDTSTGDCTSVPTPTPTAIVSTGCGLLNEPCCYTPPSTYGGGTVNCRVGQNLQCQGTTYNGMVITYYGVCLTPTPTPTLFIWTWPTKSTAIGDIFCDPLHKDKGIMTAIGCINTASPKLFTGAILNLVTALGGGLALALILYGVFIVTTSGGNPDKLKMGSEIITSAVIGLIFILLSVFLMNLIGINILALPGLS